MPTAPVEARDEQLSGVKYRGSARTKNVSGIEDMLDRLSVLASGMRVVLCNQAKIGPLRSEVGQSAKRPVVRAESTLSSISDIG